MTTSAYVVHIEDLGSDAETTAELITEALITKGFNVVEVNPWNPPSTSQPTSDPIAALDSSFKV